MYHDRTAWRCAVFVGKKYGCSKGYPQRNAAHMTIRSITQLVKPEAVTAVAEILMMGGITPETC
jgi:hypothetical protein